MEVTERIALGRTARGVTLTLAMALLLGVGSARAATQFLNDGAKQNAVTGLWELPNKGACLPVEGASVTTRPECVATMFPTYSTSATCGTALGSWSTSANVCLDAVNNTQALCADSPVSANFPAGIDRKWSNGACLLTMKGYDRNKVVCANQGGTYGPLNIVIPALGGGACFGVWTMPDSSTFTPPLLNRTGANPSTGDQCLRCHRSDTQWNVNRVRDVDSMVMTGHKNMARKVTPGTPLVGPSGAAYPTDSSGNLFDWLNGFITIGGVPTPVFWVYDGWFEDPHRPAAIYSAGSNATTGKPLMSYSCGRCHTTGWTSDSVINTAKDPEKSFPGVTWDGTTLNTTGKVNLAGGVTGDTNKLASWDLFGITCTRCHGAAVDNASHGGVPAMTAATGMSTHNNGFTATSVGSGYCSDARWSVSAQCTSAGATWIATPPCSDGVSATQLACVAAGKTWTFASCSVNSTSSTAGTVPNAAGNRAPQAYCSTPTLSTSFSTSAACVAVGGGAWADVTTAYATSSACTTAGYTWSGTTCNTCFVPNASIATASACAVLNLSPLSPTWTNNYASDVDSCIDAGGKWTDTKSQRGQVITAVCTGCHRQEVGGLPFGNASIPGNTDPDSPGTVLKVGPYHNTVTFPSHFHGNQFLNSPHAKFSGTFNQIATGNLGNGQYGSHFMADGESANTGNGCTGCHDVHKSTYSVANPAGGAVKECTECHAGPYGKDLTKMHHPTGVGTPLELMATEPAEPCVKCHMPGGQHLFRISSDPTYSTIPPQAFTNGVTGAVQPANTQADGTFSKAVWVDVNAACGQCHGGGTVNSKTTGSIASGSTTLTVANASGFAAGEAVTIAGAGTLAGQPADLPTYVTSVAGNVVTLVGKASTNVTGAAVVLNPTKKRADNSDIIYFNKASLAYYAKGIHGDAAPVVDAPPAALGSCNFSGATWSATCTSTSTDDKGILKTVIDWGDGTMLSTATPYTHTYMVPGTYTITLKVIDSIGQQTSAAIGSTTSASFQYFSVSGKVFRADNTTPISAAQIQFKKGTVLVKSTMSAADGSYTTGTIKPGIYTVTAFKAGFTFTSPALTITVGAPLTNQNISATGSPNIREGLADHASALSRRQN